MKAWVPTKYTNESYVRSLFGSRGLGLVVQGGGMRGVYSMSVLQAIRDTCPPEAFDMVIGTSSGAMNGAYFVAGQADEGRRIYEEMLSARGILGGHCQFVGGGFTNVIRPWKIVDIDYLMRIVRGHGEAEGLRMARFNAFKGDFLIGMCDAEIANPFYVRTSDLSDEETYEALRATVSLPTGYNRRVELGGGKFVDGALIDSLPVLRSLALGCRRVIVVATRPLSYRSTSESDWIGTVARLFAFGQSRYVKRWLGLPNPLLDANLELLSSSLDIAAEVFVIAPSDSDRLVTGWLDLSAGRVCDCAQMGYEDGLRSLSLLTDWLRDRHGDVAADPVH